MAERRIKPWARIVAFALGTTLDLVKYDLSREQIRELQKKLRGNGVLRKRFPTQIIKQIRSRSDT